MSLPYHWIQLLIACEGVQPVMEFHKTSDSPRYWRCGQKRIALGQRTLIMGILNITPDSFSDGGEYFDPKTAIERAHAINN
jgi:dihydropteroate synthase